MSRSDYDYQKPCIAVDKRTVTVWRHQARVREKQCWQDGTKTFFVRPPVVRHSDPRQNGSGYRIVIETVSQQAGWEFWTDTVNELQKSEASPDRDRPLKS